MPHHALELKDNVKAIANHIPAYNIGDGDYTIVMMIQVSGQVVFMNKFVPDSTARANAYTLNAGFSLFGESDGFIQMYEAQVSPPIPRGALTYANSHSVPFFDGACHYIAYVRNKLGDKYPNIGNIVFDGRLVTNYPVTFPQNLDNTANLEIGGIYSVYNGTPYWTKGSVMTAGIWGRALTLDEIKQAAFERIGNIQDSMLGFWNMNKSLADLSSNNNPLVVQGSITYKPCHHCVWTSGRNNYVFLEIEGGGHPPNETSQLVTTKRTVEVPVGTKGIYGSLMGKEAKFSVPEDVQLRVTNPTGKVYNFSSNTESLFINQKNGNLQ